MSKSQTESRIERIKISGFRKVEWPAAAASKRSGENSDEDII